MSTHPSPHSLVQLRSEIDVIDERILLALQERQEISRKIGALKQAAGLDVLQSDREEEKQAQLGVCASNLQLDKKYITAVFALILQYSRREQRKGGDHI